MRCPRHPTDSRSRPAPSQSRAKSRRPRGRSPASPPQPRTPPAAGLDREPSARRCARGAPRRSRDRARRGRGAHWWRFLWKAQWLPAWRRPWLARRRATLRQQRGPRASSGMAWAGPRRAARPERRSATRTRSPRRRFRPPSRYPRPKAPRARRATCVALSRHPGGSPHRRSTPAPAAARPRQAMRPGGAFRRLQDRWNGRLGGRAGPGPKAATRPRPRSRNDERRRSWSRLPPKARSLNDGVYITLILTYEIFMKFFANH